MIIQEDAPIGAIPGLPWAGDFQSLPFPGAIKQSNQDAREIFAADERRSVERSESLIKIGIIGA
jgi:hypothetical protein